MTTLDKALAIVKERKKTAVNKHAVFIEKLRSDEEIDRLMRKENSLKWDFVKAKNSTEQEQIKNNILICENELFSTLKLRGLPKNALEIPYFCDKCHDNGIVNGKYCKCVEILRKEIERKENPLLTSGKNGIDDIDFSFYGDESIDKQRYAEYLKKGLSDGKRYFLLAGKTGTAKTFFAISALNGMLEKGYEVSALSAIKLNKKLLEYHCAPFERKSELWQEINYVDVLLIDDLGAEQILNNVTIPYLIELLTERAERGYTYITTNLLPMEIEARYGQRVFSRLFDKKLAMAVHFIGNDLRIKRK